MTNTGTTPITTLTPDRITEAIDRHLEAYALADAESRDAIVAELWTADGELLDPPLEGRGHSEISALADVVVAHYAGHRFVRTTSVDAHHGFARYGWNLSGPDGTIAVSGTDVAQFDDAGKLLRVVGFFGPLEELTA
ncbi:MAG: nuclear transport factor 2 family protein [Ilumatobacteraceae bacterium]